jgi:nicotinamidase-related amidase
VRDALLIVDVFQDFEHEDGDAQLESLRARRPALVRALEDARDRGVPVV